MFMSEDEIRRSYREAKDPEKQIKILADMNCCTAFQIKQVLGIRTQVDEKLYARFEELYGKGMSDQKIAKETGVSHPVVARWRKTKDLPPNGKQVPKGPSESAKEDSGSGDRAKIQPYIFDAFCEASELMGKEGLPVRDIWRDVLGEVSEKIFSLSLIFDEDDGEIMAGAASLAARSVLSQYKKSKGGGD